MIKPYNSYISINLLDKTKQNLEEKKNKPSSLT